MISMVILGAGKVAKHLFNTFNKADEVIVIQWYNKTINKIENFKDKVEITDDLKAIKKADIYILAISDDAISALSKSLPFEDRLVVHTSGSVNMHDLDKKHRRGVFYPLQTFSSDSEVDFSKIPICIETKERSDLDILKKLAKSIGSQHHKITTEQRQTLHLSAVFVNNFVNQMYRIGQEISDAKHISFEILKPLILETAIKVQDLSPYQAQTGPAVRNDKKTINRHLKLLEKEEHKTIYEIMTKSIKNTHGR